MRRAYAALGGLLLTAGMAVTGPAPSTAAVPSGDRLSAVARTSLLELRAGIRRATNEERLARGLGRVRRDRCLNRSARRQALRFTVTGTLKHQDLGTVFAQCPGFRQLGENLALTYTPDPRECLRLWMASPGHRENILRPGFNRLGVGVAYDLLRGRYYAVQVFGARR